MPCGRSNRSGLFGFELVTAWLSWKEGAESRAERYSELSFAAWLGPFRSSCCFNVNTGTLSFANADNDH